MSQTIQRLKKLEKIKKIKKMMTALDYAEGSMPRAKPSV
jgi:hypothetical protein